KPLPGPPDYRPAAVDLRRRYASTAPLGEHTGMLSNWLTRALAGRGKKVQRGRTKQKWPRSFKPFIELLEERWMMSVTPYIVTKAGIDDGTSGTLSFGIAQVNAGTASEIDFSIGSGVQTITENAPLSPITHQVFINGWTQS